MRLDNFIIDAKKPSHVAWWAEQFGVAEQALLEAIAAVGERADAVSAYLKKQETEHAAHSGSVTVTTYT